MSPMIIMLDPNNPVEVEDFKNYMNEAYNAGFKDGMEQAQRNANSFNSGVQYMKQQLEQIKTEGQDTPINP